MRHNLAIGRAFASSFRIAYFALVHPVLLGALENMGVWLAFGLRCARSMGTSWGEKVRSVGTKHGSIWGLFRLEKPSKTRGYGTRKQAVSFCYVSHSTGSHQGDWFG